MESIKYKQSKRNMSVNKTSAKAKQVRLPSKIEIVNKKVEEMKVQAQ